MTDKETAIKFAEYYRKHYDGIKSIETLFEEFLNEGAKDYEIITYVDGKGNVWTNGINVAVIAGDGETHVKSVKRLLDGEVFTVGDEVDFCMPKNTVEIITDFTKWDNTIRVQHFDNKGGYSVEINHVQKVKGHLFISADGKKIYEGDTYYEASLNHNQVSEWTTEAPLFYNKELLKVLYSTRELAEEYIRKNRKRFSLEDVNKAMHRIGTNGRQKVDIEKVLENEIED